jgi:dimethylamine/trimethylamine dehydrogenase
VAIHRSSEASPHVEGRLWDDEDTGETLVVDAIHAHGTLAAIEFTHTGMAAANLLTRVPPMGPSHLPLAGRVNPIQARRMSREDIGDLRWWHRDAVERGIRVGDSVVLVTGRLPDDDLLLAFEARRDDWGDAGLETVRLVGEALSPGTTASAVWDGRRFADDLGRRRDDAIFRRDIPRPV